MQVLIVGDSEFRTLFQTMMKEVCEDWSIFDFAGGSAHPRGTTLGWCPATGPYGLKSELNKHTRKEWSKKIGDGLFDVWGDGCWGGGASWRSTDGKSVFTYGVHVNVGDNRYLSADFVKNATGNTKYDVIVMGSELHDVNQPLGSKFNQDQLHENPFALSLTAHLIAIKKWHSGPVMYVGAWATPPEKRGGSYGWAASSTLLAQLSLVARSVISKFSNVAHVELIRPSLLHRDQTHDGVHLFYPKPMKQFAHIVRHNIAVLLSKKKAA
jgi:hypothetical protein